MPKPLDPLIRDILAKYHPNPKAALWDCHGTWVVYHKDLEIIAAKAGIAFDPPSVLEADGKNKCAAICVTGKLGDRVDWSIGEASPANNKNAYPFAMCEKRARDRVILKLIGLHGFVYSEEEADDFKAPANQPAPVINDESKARYIKVCKGLIAKSDQSRDEWAAWWREEAKNRADFGLTDAEVTELSMLIAAQTKGKAA